MDEVTEEQMEIWVAWRWVKAYTSLATNFSEGDMEDARLWLERNRPPDDFDDFDAFERPLPLQRRRTRRRQDNKPVIKSGSAHDRTQHYGPHYPLRTVVCQYEEALELLGVTRIANGLEGTLGWFAAGPETSHKTPELAARAQAKFNWETCDQIASAAMDAATKIPDFGPRDEITSA